MSASPKRIALIGPSIDGMGGIASVIRNILQEYPLAGEYKLHAVPTIAKKPSFRVFIKALQDIRLMIKSKTIDLAHVHMASKGSFLRKSIIIRVCHSGKIPIIIHMHGAEFRSFYSKLSKPFQNYVKKTFAMAQCVVALSEDWLPFFQNILNVQNVVVTVNSVAVPQLAKHYQNANELPVFLFMGRLGKRKGTYDIIEAVRLLRENGCTRPFTLILAGDGDLESCTELVKKYNLADTINLPGWIGAQEKESLLKSSNVIVLPSYAEGCPMSLLEGMSYGLAALGTDIPSISAVVRGGIDGLLANAGDTESLSICIMQMLENDALCAEMGNNARNRIQQSFSHEVISKELSELYKSIL